MGMKRHLDMTTLTPFLRALLGAVEGGLPLVARHYARLGEQLGVDEKAIIDGLRELLDGGVIKRLGVIVRHRNLGYRANAMVVWDLPDDRVAATGHRLGADPVVRLCYRRPRRLPEWPYNLFTMIHGRDRQAVLAEIEELVARHALDDVHHEVLFSRRGFKQRGACYAAAAEHPIDLKPAQRQATG